MIWYDIYNFILKKFHEAKVLAYLAIWEFMQEKKRARSAPAQVDTRDFDAGDVCLGPLTDLFSHRFPLRLKHVLGFKHIEDRVEFFSFKKNRTV